MGMLLIVHLHAKKQDARDWELLREVLAILRKASNESGGSVAAGAGQLSWVFDNRTKEWSQGCSWKIVNHFLLRINLGCSYESLKALQGQNHEQEPEIPRMGPNKNAFETAPGHISTPPTSDLDSASTAVGFNESLGNTLGANTAETGVTGSHTGQPTGKYHFSVDILASVDFDPLGSCLEGHGQQA
ncbi:hypothetical protein N7468_007456 [Penicillium chermesinum]|uniref:Uncharacterized protein n=1 Tax=Penicillium chermesinum TaxID=63820 RepID=A0A9W9NU34_9EURO|nr:uncharacterized protein N7468_007456 [Penicillium chermesinum]KAJ5226231.1 hypothetical protein N7468_007456 [Penicillium chermesinum]KAJ6160584.1 hypothetical protein N7470_003980 [Penicillium chermesinum]